MGIGDIIGDLFVRISADLKGLTENIGPGGKADKELQGFTNRVNNGLLGLAKVGAIVGAVGFAAVAVGLVLATKSAIDFQASMKLLQTQAGASGAEVRDMTKGVLDMASQVGTAPDELAKGLYHLESAGFRGAIALQALRIAAEGAKVGQANLEDVTNALDAVLVAGGPDAKNMAASMGELNAIVGAGDMRMQDLADAMGTGILATAHSFGLRLKDVGAALAVMGDNNIRGADAATKLRMAISLLGAPSGKAAAELKKVGVSSTALGMAMRTGGLTAALELLQKQLGKTFDLSTKLGQTQAANALARAFGGGKTSGTILLLLQQLERLKSKEDEVTKGASGFNAAWIKTTQNVGFKWDTLTAALRTAGIVIGTVMLPYASQLLDVVTPLVPKFADWATNALPPLVEQIKQFAQTYGPGVLAFLKWGYDNFDTIKNLTLAIGIAWAAWNVGLKATAALNMVRLLSQIVAQSYIAASATKGMTAAQWLLDAAMAANPIGLVVIALVALAAAFIWAYQNVKPFRDAVNGVWNYLSQFGSWISAVFGPLMDGLGKVFSDIGKGNWSAVMHDIQSLHFGSYSFGQGGSAIARTSGTSVKGTSRAGGIMSFDMGGIVPGPVGAPTFAVVHGGERVLTPQQQQGGDMRQTNALIARLIEVVSAPPGGQTGVEAALYKATQLSKVNRARGMAGA